MKRRTPAFAFAMGAGAAWAAPVIGVFLFSIIHSGPAIAEETKPADPRPPGAETAIGVVIESLREATTAQDSSWASQPGAIRVFAAREGPNAKGSKIFKLYSAQERTAPSVDEVLADVPPGWRERPAQFIDLPARVHGRGRSRIEVFRSASELCEMYLVPEGRQWKREEPDFFSADPP